jgi:hypothetical protein
MDKLILEFNNNSIIEKNIYHNLPLPGENIKLKDNNNIFIFIGINEENKYILVNKNVKQIYGNTFVCEFDNIDKILKI